MQPMHRHTPWQRVGGLINFWQPEILQTASPNSYPRYKTLFGTTFVLEPTSKNDWKWPESHPEIQPNFGLQIKLPTVEIDQILPNHQLEHIERMEKHNKFEENGGQRCLNELHEIPSKTVQTALFHGGFRGPRWRIEVEMGWHWKREVYCF
ncbi:hypothetical protein L3X38_004076 [Prunus dulcis]|uniref:Uncharacterized protein n=1 Tax=Prunus dulcis TaxID=3755 RepID=A0AAD5F2X6_PRUDU|nr:hypothetical protein L3X38_004076 [Prunus dulcis]